MGLKVGIVGNYGHNNNGDEAILAGILNQIKGIDGNCDITIFSNTPSDTIDRYNLKTQKFKYNKGNTLFSIIYTIGKVYKNLKELDLIIIGGGQLLMDLYSRGPMLYAMYSILGKLAGKNCNISCCWSRSNINKNRKVLYWFRIKKCYFYISKRYSV